FRMWPRAGLPRVRRLGNFSRRGVSRVVSDRDDDDSTVSRAADGSELGDKDEHTGIQGTSESQISAVDVESVAVPAECQSIMQTLPAEDRETDNLSGKDCDPMESSNAATAAVNDEQVFSNGLPHAAIAVAEMEIVAPPPAAEALEVAQIPLDPVMAGE